MWQNGVGKAENVLGKFSESPALRGLDAQAKGRPVLVCLSFVCRSQWLLRLRRVSVGHSDFL